MSGTFGFVTSCGPLFRSSTRATAAPRQMTLSEGTEGTPILASLHSNIRFISQVGAAAAAAAASRRLRAERYILLVFLLLFLLCTYVLTVLLRIKYRGCSPCRHTSQQCTLPGIGFSKYTGPWAGTRSLFGRVSSRYQYEVRTRSPVSM